MLTYILNIENEKKQFERILNSRWDVKRRAESTEKVLTNLNQETKSISHLLFVRMEGSMCECLVSIWSEDLAFT